MPIFTTRPSTIWEGYTDILEDGHVSMSCPAARADENIAYLKESHERHWGGIAARTDDRLVIADDGHAYSIGTEHDYPKGFGGQRWRIRFLDGRLVYTTSLWHMGEVPAEYKERLPVNATLTALR